MVKHSNKLDQIPTYKTRKSGTDRHMWINVHIDERTDIQAVTILKRIHTVSLK